MMTLQEKALLVIEGLCLEGPRDLSQALDLIYKFAHIAGKSSNHNEGCSHADWEIELNEMYNALVAHGVI